MVLGVDTGVGPGATLGFSSGSQATRGWRSGGRGLAGDGGISTTRGRSTGKGRARGFARGHPGDYQIGDQRLRPSRRRDRLQQQAAERERSLRRPGGGAAAEQCQAERQAGAGEPALRPAVPRALARTGTTFARLPCHAVRRPRSDCFPRAGARAASRPKAPGSVRPPAGLGRRREV